MQFNDLNSLQKFCKDTESFEELKKLVGDLVKERDRKAENLQLLESAIRNDYDSILITELNLEKPGPEIVYVNDGFCEMTGYSKEEVIGKTPRMLQGPKTDSEVLRELKSRLEEGKSFFGQTVNYRKDGSEFINQWDIHPLTDEQGNITHWVSYQHDISERKRAERQLVDTKVEFDKLREESQRTVVDIDVQGNIVMANKAFRDLVGYSNDELYKLKIWDLFPNKYMKSLKGRFEQADEDAFFDKQEFRGIIKHKKEIPIQVVGDTRILDLKDKKLIRADIRNISLQKRIMGTLKKRNVNFGKIVERASEFSYNIIFEDDEPVVTYVSESFPEITGLSADAVLNANSIHKFVHEEDIENFIDHLKRANRGEKSTCEYRLLTTKNKFVEVLDFGQPEWDEAKEAVLGVHGAVTMNRAPEKKVEV